MKARLHLLTILCLAVMPVTAFGTTFDPPNRELTPDEKKVGSIYRGCNGFHCLEEESELRVSLQVAQTPCGPGEGFVSGVIGEEGYVCLTVGTNAREGVVVLMTSEERMSTCFDDAEGGMQAMTSLKEGCAEISDERPVMRTTDQAEAAYGRLKIDRIDENATGTVKLMSVIAY